MTENPNPDPSPASDSRALWRRATELDRQARDLPAGALRTPAVVPGQDLPVSTLMEVAREVGISPDSVLLSVAEGRLPDRHDLKPRDASPFWHLVLVEAVDALEVSVHLPLAPAAALPLLDRVLERPGWRMELEDRIRVEESEASVSVFRAGESPGAFGGSSFHGTLTVADARVLIVSVVAEPGGGSRLRIRMPAYERGTNLVISAGAGGLVGAGGAGAGAAVGEVVVGAFLGGATGLLPLAAVVAPAVVVAYAGAAIGVLGFRRLQRWGFGKGQTALHRLARVLEMEAREEDAKAEAGGKAGDEGQLPPG